MECGPAHENVDVTVVSKREYLVLDLDGRDWVLSLWREKGVSSLSECLARILQLCFGDIECFEYGRC
jgi:hypothetical protein